MMHLLPKVLTLSLAILVSGAYVSPAAAQFYLQLNLVSYGAVPANITDARVVNAWGLVSGPATPWLIPSANVAPM